MAVYRMVSGGNIYQRARAALELLYDGLCRVYILQPREAAGLVYGEEWAEAKAEADAEAPSWPCHLAFVQTGPTAGAARQDGSPVEARCRLFLPPEAAEALPPGSRVRVEQQGQVYWLACSGLPALYPTHLEAEARLLDLKA